MLRTLLALILLLSTISVSSVDSKSTIKPMLFARLGRSDLHSFNSFESEIEKEDDTSRVNMFNMFQYDAEMTAPIIPGNMNAKGSPETLLAIILLIAGIIAIAEIV